MAGSSRHFRAGMRAEVAVLVVDDDPGTLETTGFVLRKIGAYVHTAGTGNAALEAARRHALDLALIDLWLPDMSGVDVVRTLRAASIRIPWILVSAAMEYEAAFEAGRLGALRAVEAPFDIASVIAQALADMADGRAWPSLPLTPRLPEARTSAEHWAELVLKACDAEHDLRTLEDWRLFVAKSYSALAEASSIIGIEPRNARDFMRVLRALFRTDGRLSEIEGELHLRDYRTRDRLMHLAGASGRDFDSRIGLDEFLRTQSFIPPNHPALAALRRLLTIG